MPGRLSVANLGHLGGPWYTANSEPRPSLAQENEENTRSHGADQERGLVPARDSRSRVSFVFYQVFLIIP